MADLQEGELLRRADEIEDGLEAAGSAAAASNPDGDTGDRQADAPAKV